MSFTDPPLTTIRQSVSAIGGMAVQLLVEEIAGRLGPRTEMLFAPELVVRGSTGSGPTVRSARSAHSAATSGAARGGRTCRPVTLNCAAAEPRPGHVWLRATG